MMFHFLQLNTVYWNEQLKLSNWNIKIVQLKRLYYSIEMFMYLPVFYFNWNVWKYLINLHSQMVNFNVPVLFYSFWNHFSDSFPVDKAYIDKI